MGTLSSSSSCCCMVKAVLPKLESVSDRALTATVSKPHQGSSTVVVRLEAGTCHTKHCTYILDIVSGNGHVVLINRPFSYNYDIQPFHPCSVLQEGWRRNNMLEKLRLWLWHGLSETWGPDDANSQRAVIDSCRHLHREACFFHRSMVLCTTVWI